MNRVPSLRKVLLAFVLLGATLSAACGNSAEGKYRDPTGSINCEFKNGKAYIALGAYAVDGTYTIEGNRIIAKGDRRTAGQHDSPPRKGEVAILIFTRIAINSRNSKPSTHL